MLRQKLVYCPVAPSESHVWALQEDFQILVEFGSGCWKMESTSPWEDQSTVPRDAWKSSVFKFVSFHSNKTSNYFWDTQISGLQSFPPQYNPSPSISSKKFLKFSIIRTLNRWNHFLKITKITNFHYDTKYFLLSPFKRVIFPIPQEFREWLLKIHLKLPEKTLFKVLKKKSKSLKLL